MPPSTSRPLLPFVAPPTDVLKWTQICMSKAPTSLLFLLSCCSLFSDRAVAFHLGVIVNTNSLVGREQKIAIETAAHYFNSSTTTLFLDVCESNSIDPIQANAYARSLMKRGAEAVIATGTWPEVVTLAGIGSKERIPVLSLATTSPPTLSPRPFLVRMSYPASGQARCLAQVVKSYNWRRVIVIYEDDDYGSITAMASLLFDALNTVGSEVIDYIAFPPVDTLSNPRASVQKELKRIRRHLSRVYIILQSSRLLTVSLFEEAKELGMMAKGHVWIANDDTTTLLDSTLEPSFISSHMQGVVGIKTYFDETSDSYQVFKAEFQRKFKADYGSKGEPGKFAVRAYDGVHAIAHAAVETKTMRSNTLLEGILSSHFMGLSGFIRFRSDGGLPEGKGYSAFRVVNVAGKSYRELGFWLEGFGFYKEEGEMVRHGERVDALSPVYWPGGPERVPSGWGKLKIGVPTTATFDQFVKVEYDERRMVKKVTGFCIDVFNETLVHLKYDLEYEFLAFNGTYDNLLNQIPLKVYDAAVGDITILDKRSINVTFTEPYLSSGLSMLVRMRSNRTQWMFTKPFTMRVWLLIIATMIYTGIIMWYLEHKINPEFDGPWWTQLGATFWLTISTIFFAHGRLYSYYTKIVAVVWLVAVFILTSCFTANLSSILTTEKLEPMVVDGKIGYDGDLFVRKYLQDVLGYKEDKFVKIGKAENYVDAFESGNITAAILEVPYLRVFISKHDDYTAQGETYMLGGFGFAFPKGSPMAEDFSRAILGLTEDGTLKKLEDKWFSFSMSNCPTPDKDGKRDSLSLDSFWVLFLFVGGTSTIVFLIETRLTIHHAVGVSLMEIFNMIRRSRNSWKRGGLGLQGVATFSSDQEGNATSMDQRPSDHMIELHRHACDDNEQTRW
ncbi:glutamate receptor 2.7 [Elaeis guineensis]|uniref:Glutamate receptor n=1 Tax=Elaeis guineensis var. tenera TaxID=51953 RepID=A0A6I9QJ25_ELAGV|nr:glutamate receptor 2.7 [Elaeis guineensis]